MNKQAVNTNALNVKDAQNNMPVIAVNDFKEALQASIGLSPLATGTKFESDDLVNADTVRLIDFDWAEYVEHAGEPNEREVKFTIWQVEVTAMDGEITRGYYQGGTVLNKLARAIEEKGLFGELSAYGININAHWGKTAGKNDILLIDIL